MHSLDENSRDKLTHNGIDSKGGMASSGTSTAYRTGTLVPTRRSYHVGGVTPASMTHPTNRHTHATSDPAATSENRTAEPLRIGRTHSTYTAADSSSEMREQSVKR